jgi:hypothetical protein
MLPLMLAACAAACARNTEQDAEPQVCTRIGCSDGVTVEVTGNRTAHVAVEVVAGGVVVDTFDCEASDATCRSMIEGLSEGRITVTIRSGDQSNQRTYEPEFRNVRPNGPDCPPVCRQATVSIAVP